MYSNCNVFIHFQVFYILLYTYCLDQATNVLNVTEFSALNKNAGDFITPFFFLSHSS